MLTRRILGIAFTFLLAMTAFAEISLLPATPFLPEVLVCKGTAMAPFTVLSLLPGVSAKTGKLPGTYLVTFKEEKFSFALQNTMAYHGKTEVTLPMQPFERFGETYIPLQSCIEAFGGTCTLAFDKQCASIALPGMEKPRDFTLRELENGSPTLRKPGQLPELFLMNIDGTELCRVTENTVWDYLPALSRDGKSMAFVSEVPLENGHPDVILRSLQLFTRAATGQTSKLPALPEGEVLLGRSVQFSPDGTTILYQTYVARGMVIGNTKIRLIGTDGANPRLLVEGGLPCFSPDGKSVAYSYWPKGQQATLCIIDIDGKNQRTLGTGSTPVFSPDGTQLIWNIIYQAAGGTVVMPARYVLSGAGAGTLFEAPPEQRTRREVGTCFSPDGQHLVFAREKDGIIITDLARKEMRQLTTNQQDREPQYTRDGKYILFLRGQQLYRVPTTGGNPAVLSKGLGVRYYTLTPDGKQLLVLATR